MPEVMSSVHRAPESNLTAVSVALQLVRSHVKSMHSPTPANMVIWFWIRAQTTTVVLACFYVNVLCGVCRDMCDNMERFFYQAWKEASLPLPPGAGPTLSRTRPKNPKGPAWQDEDQGARSNKRKRTDAHYEVCTDPLWLCSLSRASSICPSFPCLLARSPTHSPTH